MITFSILGIFSVRYRKLAKEAFDCVSRRVTFRPCESKLDQRLKSKLTANLLDTPRLAKFVYKQFEIISWVFVLIFFSSMFYTGYSLYNLIVYHACDPHNPEGCVFGYEQICSIECKPCKCREWGCESPEFKACGGVCKCRPGVCG